MSQPGTGPYTSGPPTLSGLISVLFGGACVALGIWIMVQGNEALRLFGVVKEAAKEEAKKTAGAKGEEKVEEVAGTIERLAKGMILVVGGCPLVQGLVILLAGVGVLGRRNWGRLLTFLMAILCALEAAGLVKIAMDQNKTVEDVIMPVAVLGGYFLASFVLLLGRGREFS
jgi:hypothetical protein